MILYLGLAEKVRNVADIRRESRRCINPNSAFENAESPKKK